MLFSTKEYFLLGISFLHLNSLENFCNHTLEFYDNVVNLKQLENIYFDTVSKHGVGGISDMTLVATWLENNSDDNIMNLVDVKNNTTFDHNIGLTKQAEDDSYKFRRGLKSIILKNNLPYCYSYKYKKNIRFHLLHFQGPAKYLMTRFYTGKSFPRKLRLDIKFFFANIAAFWYKSLRIRYHFAWLFNIIFKLKAK